MRCDKIQRQRLADISTFDYHLNYQLMKQRILLWMGSLFDVFTSLHKNYHSRFVGEKFIQMIACRLLAVSKMSFVEKFDDKFIIYLLVDVIRNIH